MKAVRAEQGAPKARKAKGLNRRPGAGVHKNKKAYKRKEKFGDRDYSVAFLIMIIVILELIWVNF